MKIRTVLTGIIILPLIFLAGCEGNVTLRDVEQSVLLDWFYSRFGWAILYAAICGVAISILLCRLKVKEPLTHCNRKARIIFWSTTSFLVLLGIPLWLLTESYTVQPFGNLVSRVELWNCFFLVVMHWITLAIMIVFTVALYLVVGICTRFIFGGLLNRCNCRYAFFP